VGISFESATRSSKRTDTVLFYARFWATNYSQRGAANSYTINGTALSTATFVEIHWGWLGFLAGELVVAVAFLVATVVLTRNLDLPVVKSSALAVLLAPGAGTRAAIGGVDRDARHLRKRAGTARARFDGAEMVLSVPDLEQQPAATGATARRETA